MNNDADQWGPPLFFSLAPSPPVETGGGKQHQTGHIVTLPQTDRHPTKIFFIEIEILVYL